MKLKRKKAKMKNLIARIFIILAVLLVVGVGVYYFLTAEDEDNGLTLLEKQWVENNKSVLVDIDIPNNIYLYGEGGDGVFFDFLNYVNKETGLSFNKKPYNYPKNENTESLGIVVLKPEDALNSTDVLIDYDNYVLVSQKGEEILNIRQISKKTVGILSTDSTSLGSYFATNNIDVKTYSSVSDLIEGLKINEVSYIAIPRYSYLNSIDEKQLGVSYVIENLSNKFVLRLGKDEKLNTIIAKLLDNYKQESLREDLETHLLAFYSTKKSLTEIEKTTLSNRVYKYGYVKNTSYNVISGDRIYGVAGEYINTLINMGNMEFSFVPYDNIEELKKDLDSSKLDMAFVNFQYESENYKKTFSQFDEQLVALSKNVINITDKYGLTNNKLYLTKDNMLYDYVSSNINASVKTIDNYTKDISDDGVLVLDKNDYLYLKNSTLKDYNYLLTDRFSGNYHFVVKQNDDVLFNLLDYTLRNTNNNQYEEIAIDNILNLNSNKTIFKGTYMIIVAIIVCPILLLLIGLIIIRNTSDLRISKKELILKYNDMLTNLKNRNYLNANIDKWDNTKIYPRTIVMIDLNNLKYVNDNYGHEEGNNLIKKAASILINTQLEKSDIIRTDGNEFLIYLIGYSKTQITTYLSKLTKEFDKLPYGFGAAIGYSMITDEIKTVDDAINEATIEMRMDKEKNYR